MPHAVEMLKQMLLYFLKNILSVIVPIVILSILKTTSGFPTVLFTTTLVP